MFHHVFNFPHLHFYSTYIYNYFIMYLFLHTDTFILITLILISWYLDFHTLMFLYYLHQYLFLNLLIFTPWEFYVTYTYTCFIMYWLLDIDFFMLFTLTFIWSCIDFYIFPCLYYLHLYIFHQVFIFTH